jgi:hypothetical protein
MADNKDESGKGNARPGETPAGKRPYATIDLEATEIGARGGPSSTDEAKPNAPGSAARPQTQSSTSGAKGLEAESLTGAGRVKEAAREAVARLSSLTTRARSAPFLTHLAAGATGAVIVLIATYLPTPDRAPAPRLVPEVGELTRRLSDLESVLGTRPGAAGLRARVDEVSRNLGALGNAQAKLARDAKDLEGRIGSGQDAPMELAGRIAKLEQAAAAPTPGDQTGQLPPSTALSTRLAELEKAAREGNDAAKSATARVVGELAAVRTEAGRLAQRIDGLKGEVEERMKAAAKAADFAPLAQRLAALERDLQGFEKNEADRRADAGRVVLALELAALRRAVDRGDSYATELAAVKKMAGDSLNLTALERHMREGVAPVRELEKSFRQVADAMLDAEVERPDATLLDRLISGARSIVRVRKAGHAADDVSAEAVVGRIETALKEGRLTEVVANAKTLPPKAALAGEDWIKRLEARQSVDQAMGDVEAALKTSLGIPRASGAEPQR